MTSHVIVGLSGGVDSSVAALILLEQGHEVAAWFMKNWHGQDEAGGCAWEEDVEDALHVCEQLGIPLNTVDLSAHYRDTVFADFLRAYQAGLTPNPDIVCNQEVKFRAFLQHALDLGVSQIATGHYARIRQDEAGLHLLKSHDPAKDQSYFLCRLTQQQLQHSLFPIGPMRKAEVRARARAAGLITHNKKDSTGICFIGERPFRAFLGQYLPVNKGPIVSLDGVTMGEHDGVHFYTLGQRHGLGIGGVAGHGQAPWYVVEKAVDDNRLIIAQGHDHPALFSQHLCAENMHWIGGPPEQETFTCTARTRYRQTEQPCTVTLCAEKQIQVHFNQPQRAITLGQYVVLYQAEECLGGGVISTTS